MDRSFSSPWNLLTEFDAWLSELRRKLDEIFLEVAKSTWVPEIRAPVLDMACNDDQYLLRVELPGLQKENIKVDIDNGILRIKAKKQIEQDHIEWEFLKRERGQLMFSREVILPEDVAIDLGIQVNFSQGLLEINIPRKPNEQKLHIEIA